MADSNVATLRSLYDEFVSSKGHRIERLIEHLGEEVEWCSAGSPDCNLFMQDGRGWEQVRAYFRGLNEQWEMERFDVEDFVGEGDRIVMLATVSFRNRTTGKHIDCRKADVWGFRDGKIVSFYEFFDTAQAASACTAG